MKPAALPLASSFSALVCGKAGIGIFRGLGARAGVLLCVQIRFQNLGQFFQRCFGTLPVRAQHHYIPV